MTDPNTNQPPVPPVPPASQPAAPAYSAPAAPAYGAPASSKYNVLAIVSLVSAFFISLAAIITGHIALSQIKKTGEQGRGLAIAGLILGYAGLVAGIIFLIVWVAVFGAAMSSGSFTTY